MKSIIKDLSKSLEGGIGMFSIESLVHLLLYIYFSSVILFFISFLWYMIKGDYKEKPITAVIGEGFAAVIPILNTIYVLLIINATISFCLKKISNLKMHKK